MSHMEEENSKEDAAMVTLDDYSEDSSDESSLKPLQEIHLENEEEPQNLNVETKKESTKQKIWKYVDKYWFFAGIILAVLLAFAWPPLGKKGGYIRSEYSLKYGAISIIFLVSGLSLRTKDLWAAFKYVKLHLVIQGYNLLFTPLFVFGTIKLITLVYDLGPLADGLVIMAAVPTTVSSSVVLTRAAHGNEAAALFNSTMGNLIGLGVTPAMLLLLLGTSKMAPLTSVFLSLGFTVLLPIAVGQIIQHLFPAFVDRVKKTINFSKVNNFILLLIVWSAFCDTFSGDEDVGGGELAFVVSLTLIYHAIFLVLAFLLGGIPAFHFPRADRATILLMGTQKTMSLGIPLIHIIYETDPNVGLKTLPLLIYHPAQLLIAALFLSKLQSWVDNDPLAPEESFLQP